jgi:hypothetical protein
MYLGQTLSLLNVCDECPGNFSLAAETMRAISSAGASYNVLIISVVDVSEKKL